MFTGLVQQVGRIVRVDRLGADARLVVEASFEGVLDGESIAVDGACLTVSEVRKDGFAASASAETLSRTTLSGLSPGSPVHLERALALGDRLGGHIVTGHVDVVARVLDRRERGQALEVGYALPEAIARTVAEKGSIAIDGVSLTVNSVSREAFRVMLVPFTRKETHLDRKKPGESVNLEADVLAKYVARLVDPEAARDSGITMDFLARHGFTR